MKNDLIIYGYNCKNLGDDLMFAEIINKTDYKRYFFIGHGEVPNFVNKEIYFIKPGRLMKLRWKLKADFAVIGGSVLMGASPQQKDAIKQKIEWFLLDSIKLPGLDSSKKWILSKNQIIYQRPSIQNFLLVEEYTKDFIEEKNNEINERDGCILSTNNKCRRTCSKNGKDSRFLPRNYNTKSN